MSGLNDTLKQAIQQLAGTHLKDNVHIIECNVDSVDEDAFECDVTTIGGNGELSIPGVKLAAEDNDGFTLIPAIDSTVYVTMTDNGLVYVSMFSDVSKVVAIINKTKLIIEDGKITMNDGSFEGLVKVKKLTDKINALENQINTILQILAATTIPLAPSGSYPFASLYASVLPITPITTQAEIENDKIKHGI